MFRTVFLVFLSLVFSLSQGTAGYLGDLDDERKNIKIEAKNLEGFIRTVYKSRAEYLRKKLDDFENSGHELKLGSTRDKKLTVVIQSNEPLLENKGYKKYHELYVNSYKSWLTFFEDDPFTLFNEMKREMKGKDLTFTLSDPLDLSFFYKKMASILKTFYTQIQEDIKACYEDSHRIILEPIIVDEEDAMEDIVQLIRVIQPHLKKGKSKPQNKFIEEGKKIIHELAYQERISVLKGWMKLSDNQEFQEGLTGLKVASWKKLAEKLPIGIDESYSSGVSQVEKVWETSPDDKAFSQKKKTKPLPQKELKMKKKTRPSEEKNFLQSFDYFRKEGALTAVERKLKEESLQPTPSSKIDESYPVPEHKRRLKILEKLLNPKKEMAINVDKTLNFFKHFGFIKENIVDLNHEKLQVKPVALWLNGERTLIEIPPVTLAVSHKSNGKRYFKSYIVEKIRSALLKAGFDKLLENKSE